MWIYTPRSYHRQIVGQSCLFLVLATTWLKGVVYKVPTFTSIHEKDGCTKDDDAGDVAVYQCHPGLFGLAWQTGLPESHTHIYVLRM